MLTCSFLGVGLGMSFSGLKLSKSSSNLHYFLFDLGGGASSDSR